MLKIINTETGTTYHKLGDQSLKINNAITDNHGMIANTINKHLILVADSIINILYDTQYQFHPTISLAKFHQGLITLE